MKLIIDIPEESYEYVKANSRLGWLTSSEFADAIENGTPLDDVKAEIQRTITASWYNGENYKKKYRDGLNDAIKILDKIFRIRK